MNQEHFELLPEWVRSECVSYDEQVGEESTTETYTYMDEDGVEHKGEREVLVPVYEIRYKLRPQPEAVGKAKVELVISLGKPEEVIALFAGKAIEFTLWSAASDWFAWDEVEITEPERSHNEEGEEVWLGGYTPELHAEALQAHADAEPTEPVAVTTDAYLKSCAGYVSLEDKAKVTRDEAILADIEVNGFVWQVDDKGRDNMRSTLETAERGAYPEDTQIAWILSDNTIHMTTAPELGLVLSAYTVRMGDVYQAYGAWRAGDNEEAFVWNGQS